jgi:hypothetical protein
VFLGTHYRHEVHFSDGQLVRWLTAGPIDAAPGESVELDIADGKGIVVRERADEQPLPPLDDAEVPADTVESDVQVASREA